jgi:hypothetical protein
MEDILKDLSPFLLAILYFLLSALGGKKKKKNNRVPSPQRNFNEAEEVQEPKRKPLTFEDLLREIEGYTNPSMDEAKPPQKESATSMSTEEQPSSRAFKDYEASVRSPKKYSRLGDRIQLETTISSKKMQVEVEDLENEEVMPVSSFAQDIKNALQTQDGARKAIIYSEILNRKYS